MSAYSPEISIIYVSHGHKNNSTYESLGISYQEIEGEEKESTGIYQNYCCGIAVDIYCVYLAKEEEFIECDQGIHVHFIKDSNANPVLSRIDTKYICIVDQGIILTSGQWLVSLLFNYEFINKSGVIGISIDTIRQIPAFLADSSESETIIFLPKDGIIDGIAFFSKLAYYHIGIFGKNLRGWEIPHFCIRALNHGYHNYYIDNQYAMGYINKADSIGRMNMQASLQEMKKNKNWYLPEN